MREISRQMYSLLDWMGDWGGLIDALFMLAQAVMSPLSLLALKAKLAVAFANTIQVTAGGCSQDGDRKSLDSRSLMSKVLDKCRRSKKRKLLDRTMTLVKKELDLVKLISLQKMLVLAALSSLSNDQRTLIDSRSHLVVRSESESSADNTP